MYKILLPTEKNIMGVIDDLLRFEATLFKHKNCESLGNVRANQFYINRFTCSFPELVYKKKVEPSQFERAY